MNPLTNMKNVTKLSEQELYTNNRTSWHDQYKDSAWVFIGGLPYDLSEGDIICIFSQYGEVVNINLIRDKDNGKSKGFCFLCYEDQRSTVLAVDNFNGIRVLNRILRVDHVSNYKIPKQGEKTDDVTKKLYSEGCAPKSVVQNVNKHVVKLESQCLRETLADQIQADIKLPERLPIYPIKKEPDEEVENRDNEEKVDVQKGTPQNVSRSESETDHRKKKKHTKRRYSSDSNDEEQSQTKSMEKNRKSSDNSRERDSVKNKFSKKYKEEIRHKRQNIEKTLRRSPTHDHRNYQDDKKKTHSREDSRYKQSREHKK